MVHLSKHLRTFSNRHEHGGRGGGPILVRPVTEDMDPKEAARIYIWWGALF